MCVAASRRFPLILHLTPRLRGDTPSPRSSQCLILAGTSASARRAPARTPARCVGGPSRTCSASSSPDLEVPFIIIIESPHHHHHRRRRRGAAFNIYEYLPGSSEVLAYRHTSFNEQACKLTAQGCLTSADKRGTIRALARCQGCCDERCNGCARRSSSTPRRPVQHCGPRRCDG